MDCGHNSNFNAEPQPRIDMGGGTARTPATFIGLFKLWIEDMTSQGDPVDCFGADGIVDTSVSVLAGAAGVNVQLFFQGDPSTLSDHPKCGGPFDPINYTVGIGPCILDGNFPPVSGGEAVIMCEAGTAASVRTSGGGGVAAKCGCRATGTLTADFGMTNTVIKIQSLAAPPP